MPIYLGTKRVDDLYLGAKGISKVYLGTTLVYDKSDTPTGASVLYDNGLVDGIPWSGNMLPRPQYTSIASYSFEETRMALTVASQSGYSSVNHNCHVCTSGLITVPAGVTVMKVQAIATDLSGGATPYINFGLLTTNCVNAMDATNGGQLSGVINASANVLTVYTMNLNSGIAGNSWLAVVNMRRNAKADYPCTIRIAKVWFE